MDYAAPPLQLTVATAPLAVDNSNPPKDEQSTVCLNEQPALRIRLGVTAPRPLQPFKASQPCTQPPTPAATMACTASISTDNPYPNHIPRL